MDIDTLIVGGGFAGVSAARELTQLEENVVLIEARDRLGGRTWTSDFEGHQIELGGAYVHSTQPFVWTEIQRYGLHADGILSDDFKVIYYDGNQSTELDGSAWIGEMIPIFHAYYEPLLTTLPRPYDVKANWELMCSMDDKTASERLNEMELTPMQRTTLTAFLEVGSHNTIENTSYIEMMRWYALSGNNLPALIESVGTYKLREGTSALINAIAGDSNADVRLSTKVLKIEQNSSGVRVFTDSGDPIFAKKVLVTVPMNVVDQIEFNPEIDKARIDAAKERHAGEGFKVFLLAKGNLGGLWCCSASADCPLMSISGYHFSDDQTVLVAFGHSRSEVNLDDHVQMQTWMQNFMPDIEIIKSTGHKWNEDPYSLGTYCTYRPSQMSKYFDALQKNEGRIYFAGGDIGDGWRGFIDGAIGSGITTARRMASTRTG